MTSDPAPIQPDRQEWQLDQQADSNSTGLHAPDTDLTLILHHGLSQIDLFTKLTALGHSSLHLNQKMAKGDI